MKHAAAVLALIALLSAAAPLLADDPVTPAPAAAAMEGPFDLRPRFKQGQTTRYEVWTLRDTTMTVNASGREQSVSTRMELKGEVTWGVERVKADGSATCTMTLDWLAVTLTNPDGSTSGVDSRRGSGDNEAVHRLIKGMAGVPIRLEMSADGTALSSKGSDQVRQRVGGEIKTPDDLDYMESASDLATLVAAPAEAKAGGSWDAAFSWNHELGRLNQQMRYTLVSVEDVAGIPVANVTGKASLRLEPDMAKLNAGGGEGPKPKIDVRLLSGEMTTQVMFDLQRREAVGRNTTQTTRIETKLRIENQTFSRTTSETIQSQALRIEER